MRVVNLLRQIAAIVVVCSGSDCGWLGSAGHISDQTLCLLTMNRGSAESCYDWGLRIGSVTSLGLTGWGGATVPNSELGFAGVE